MPTNGICLASNRVNKVQSLYFELGISKIYGLQYHPEITYEKMISLIEFRKKRLIEFRKVFKNEIDVEKHILSIRKETITKKVAIQPIVSINSIPIIYLFHSRIIQIKLVDY